MLTLVPDTKLKRRQEATLTAKVTQGGVPQAGRTVTFTPADTTLASVSPDTGVTDGNGEAKTTVRGEYRGLEKTTTIAVTVDGVSRDQIVRVPDISPIVLVLLVACIVLFCLFRKEQVGASKI